MIDGSNITSWHCLDATAETEPFTSTPFLIRTKRPMGCQFLNTHSVPVSKVFACNKNVQIGEPCNLFYAMCYTFKMTQKEDADRFILIGTKVIRRLMHMRSIALQNAELNKSDEENDKKHWLESFTRLLSGMSASLSKAVCSSIMGRFIVCNDGTRFQYSRGFAKLLVGQALDVLEGGEGNFRICTNLSKNTIEKVYWAKVLRGGRTHVSPLRTKHGDKTEMCHLGW